MRAAQAPPSSFSMKFRSRGARGAGASPALGMAAGGSGAPSSAAGAIGRRAGASGAGGASALCAGRPIASGSPTASGGAGGGASATGASTLRQTPDGSCGRRHALERRLHEAAPDFDRQIAARDLLGRRIVVVAEPDAGDERAGVADEPGVAPILAGAGLARRLPARQLGLVRGAGQQRLFHHRVHHRDVLRIDDAAEIGVLAGVEQLAVGGAHAGDDMRLHADAAVGEGVVGGDQLERRHRRGAERDRRVGLEVGGDAEPMGGAHDRLRPDFQAEPTATVLSDSASALVSVTGPKYSRE